MNDEQGRRLSEARSLYAEAVGAMNRAQWPLARELGMRLLRMAPDNANAHFIVGMANSRLQEVEAAINHLKRATLLNPDRPEYWVELARACLDGWLIAGASGAADKAFALGSADALVWARLGMIYGRARVQERSTAAIKRAVELAPGSAEYRYSLTVALMAMGDIAGAEHECLECLRLNPQLWKAWLMLSKLRKQTAQDNHLSRLQQQLAANENNDEAALYLNLALAKELEDMAEYPRAFAHLGEGKRRDRLGRNYAPEQDRELFRALMETPMTPLTGATGDPSSAPIFVIGMPRSGTTLVERILSSHTQVHSAGELENFPLAVKRISGSATPSLTDVDTIRRAGTLDWLRLGRQYIENTRMRTGGKRHFVDKLPHNFLYAGHIARALPNASIVCLRRGPMDTCLSNFRQLFSPYFGYTFDLLNTGRYYLLFDRLMAHWQRTLPGRILQVDYEDLVDDQEAVTRRLLAHCRLPWEDACMRFEDNDLPVSTASAVQVRSSMFRSALQRWKRYEPQLVELRALLEAGGVRVE